MTDLRKAAELALEAMERRNAVNDEYKVYLQDAIETLRQALAQPEQEPVAWISDSPTKGNGKQLYWTMEQAWKWSSNITPLYTAPSGKQKQEPVTLESVYETIIHWDDGGGKRSRRELARRITELYTAPPSKPWVSLTDEEIMEPWPFETRIELVRWIEAKLREKNK